MKKRFLPFSLLLVIMVLGQSMAIADQGGHYVPRTQTTMNADAYMGSLRVNQHTGLIDPADMFKAMQASATKNAADEPLYWISMGPDNMGGQTTAVVYDNQSNVVYIGSKGGGVYKTYNNGVTWHQVGNMNLMVSCMVQDEDGIIYVGTGDGNSGQKYNGLDQQNYTTSFVGTGVWTINVKNNDAMQQIVAPTADEWLFVNELTFSKNYLLAATSEGLKYSSNKGQTWQMARYIAGTDEEAQDLEGDAAEVKVMFDNTIVASVDGKIYVGDDINKLKCCSSNGNQMQGDSLIPKAAGLLDIAVGKYADSETQKDVAVLYAACIDGSGSHAGVYYTENKGANWVKILPNAGNGYGHTIYDGYGLYNHGLVVDPNDYGTVYVLGYKLWRLQRPVSGTGYYSCDAITGNSVIYDDAYLHVGLHTMVFNPKNNKEFYIGTDGGVYRGKSDFTFFNCNRNYVTSRMFNVAYSGKDTRIMAAGLDHGTVLIEGDEDANTMGTGAWINPSGDNMGTFNEASQAGPCAFSMINPNTIFVTYKEGGLERSETCGEDWVSTNFTSHSSLSLSTSSFRMPILLVENYNDELSLSKVWYFNTSDEDEEAGQVVKCLSNSQYPFEHTLEAPVAAGDSVEIHDPISAKLFITFSDALYMTLTPLNFAVETKWYKVAAKAQPSGFKGEPLCIGASADANYVFVGMKNGKFYRVSNLNTVVDDATGTMSDSLFQVTNTEITLPTDGQCVTSVSVDPRDANKVIVTLGNYGNEDYVLYSTNALSDAPVFNSVQGNLPKMPVYSSLIEMNTGDVILGTERGIYRTKDITSAQWTADNQIMGEVPVMELKQQRMYKEDMTMIKVTSDGVFETFYPGVHNTGIIYAATYGRGVFRCENYKKEFASVPETPAIAEEVNVSMYPNPVQSQATVSFNVKGSTNVSYQVFDMSGRMVMNQNMGRMGEGEHQVELNAENLSSGSYILRLNQDGNSSCVKFMVY